MKYSRVIVRVNGKRARKTIRFDVSNNSSGNESQDSQNWEGTGDLRREGSMEGVDHSSFVVAGTNGYRQRNTHISIEVIAVNLIQNYFMQFVQSAFQNNNRAVRPLNPPRRRRRRSAKFCRKVRGRQQKDSTTFAIWKEHTSVNPQQVIYPPPLPATTSLSHHKTRDQLIFENVYERREKDKAKVKVAKEKAKKERQCSLKNKQASKVHDLCATLRAARSQLRESKKEGVEQGKKIESMAKELSVMNQVWTDKIDNVAAVSDAKLTMELSKLEDKYDEATEKKMKVCHYIYSALLFHLHHCLSISSFISFIL